MKPFWDDLFYDLENNDREAMADQYGEMIRSDLRRIEDEIRAFNLNKALDLLVEAKKNY